MNRDPIPPSQMFRALLLHMLETHRVLTPYVAHSTSKELRLCHSENTYMLSEIKSWLADLADDADLSPEYSPAQAAELLAGVVSATKAPPRVMPAGAPATPSAQSVPAEPRRGSPRAHSSRRSASTPVAWERTSTGQIIFRPK